MAAGDGRVEGPRATAFTFDPGLLADDTAGRDGRDREWARVYGHFDPRLRDFFARRAGGPDDLDELMALLWRRVVRRIGALRDSRGAWAWLVVIGTNLLRDRAAGEAAARRLQEGYAAERASDLQGGEAADPAPSALARLAEEGATGLAERLGVDPAEFARRLEALPAADRALVRLKVLDGLEHEQIAERLGLASAAASRQRFARLRRRLGAS